MKTFQQFTAEAYRGEYDRRGRRPVRGRDYDDYSDGYKTRMSAGLQSGEMSKNKTPKKKSAAERMDSAGKKLGLPEEVVDEGIGMTMANAIGNPPALSKRMKLKQALIINKIKSDAKKKKEKKYSGKAAKELDENVSSGSSRRARFGVKQRVSSAEVITNTEKQNKIAKHFSDHAARKKSAGDEAHAAATKAGKSPMEAETSRQRAHRNYEKQMKSGK